MKNDALAIASTPAASGADPVAEALANLTDVGIAFTEVAGCPFPRCAVCTPQDMRHAA